MSEATGNFNMVKIINENTQVPLTFVGKGKRIPFSTAEDNLLRELHKRFGDNWEEITKRFNEVQLNHINRSSQALRARWRDYLNPNLPLPFSREEDNLLREKVKEFGDRAFDKIQIFFPNRSANELKNRWNKIKNLKKGYHKPRNFTEAEIAEIIAIKQANPDATSQKVTDILNANHSDKPPKAERGVRNVLTKAKKAGLISKAEINTNQNSQNLTVNQNNSEQNVFPFQFNYDEDNFFNQDDIPELEDSDNKYFYY